MTHTDHLLHDNVTLHYTFPFLSPRKIAKPPPGASQTGHTKNKKEIRTDANLPPVRYQSGPGNLLASLWRPEISIWQHAGCPVVGSLVAVTQCPERDILLGLGQRWLVLRDYPLAC